MGKVLRLGIFMCLMSIGAAFAVGTACANERSAELVNSFQTFCTPGPPDFAALDAKATAMNLPVRKDIVPPSHAGQSARAKSWLISLKSGSHELVASEARGPNGEVASCGIGAEDVDGEDMKQELIKVQGAPLRETASADGSQRVTVWKYADDVTLLLADGTPMKIPGMYLTLLHQKNTSR